MAKYRAEAKRLIQSVDDALGPAREEVEKALELRLARAGLAKGPTAGAEAGHAPPGKPEPETESEPEKPAEPAPEEKP